MRQKNSLILINAQTKKACSSSESPVIPACWFCHITCTGWSITALQIKKTPLITKWANDVNIIIRYKAGEELFIPI